MECRHLFSLYSLGSYGWRRFNFLCYFVRGYSLDASVYCREWTGSNGIDEHDDSRINGHNVEVTDRVDEDVFGMCSIVRGARVGRDGSQGTDIDVFSSVSCLFRCVDLFDVSGTRNAIGCDDTCPVLLHTTWGLEKMTYKPRIECFPLCCCHIVKW